MNSSQLSENEYSGGFATYIREAGDVNLIEELEISLHDFIRFVQNIPMDKFDYRYAEGKWTIKDIIQHLMDCERIFAYRALRFSRNDKTPLASFEEDDYANNTDSNKRSIQDLLTELSALRHSIADTLAPSKLAKSIFFKISRSQSIESFLILRSDRGPLAASLRAGLNFLGM